MTPIYQSTATVLVRPAQASSQTGLQPVDQVAKTYAQLMTKRPLVQQVIDELNLPYSTEELQANISVTPEKDTELLDVKVQDPDPKLAALIANTLVQDFIAQNEAREQQQIKASLASLQRRIDELELQITANGREIALLQAKPRPTPDDLAQLTNLQERKAADSTTYATLFKNYQDLRSSQLARYETLAVVDPAVPGKRPIKPNKLLNTLLAGAMGAMLAIGLILLIEYLDDSLKSEEDVRRYLNLPVLGNLIFRRSGREGQLITLTESSLPASEAFRTLRTNLLFSRVDSGLRTIVVASAVPGEGKTRTAANLAITLAQTGQRCILVDADFRRPSLHRIFGLSQQRGLSDMILDNVIDPADILDTQLPTLKVILSGTQPPNPSELLGSQRMLRIVHELCAKADVVVFDTPPLNAVTDAALLAARLDATILVIEAGRTHRSAVLLAKEAIEKVGGSLAGVVLNKTRWLAQRNYYGYRSAAPVVSAAPTLPLKVTPPPALQERAG
jgi:non-specific protein-tyrosine kinase